MLKDAPLDGGALTHGFADHVLHAAQVRVSGMQAKLHRWTATDADRRFDDLFNFVCDPSTLTIAWTRVAGNTGGRSAGIDGVRAADIEQAGLARFLEDLRSDLRSGIFRPTPVRERMIPKPGGNGKMRRLGIPTVADRVVQAAAKLVLEPIFETDFEPVSYGFRPGRRAQDAIAEIHLFGTSGYRWVLDADIEACFDMIDHTALMGRVRARVKDKRVLRLVKAFLKAGILTELGEERDTPTGTPQGGILSPLLANIALSVLDEYVHAPWKPGQAMSTSQRRKTRRTHSLPNWRIVRYADDFVILVHGTCDDVDTLKEEIAQVLAPMGLRLSESKTTVVHMSDGFDFLGFHIQWKRKPGTKKWYVYTFIAKRSIRSVKAKIRALTRRSSTADLKETLIRINQILRGWTNYFRHAVAMSTFNHIQQFTWWRIVSWQKKLHRWGWGQVRRWLTDHTGRWQPISAQGTRLYNPATIGITRYRYRGAKIQPPWV